MAENESIQYTRPRSNAPVRTSPRPQLRSSNINPSFGSRFMSGLRSLGSQLKNDFNHQTGRNLYTGAALDNFNARSQPRLDSIEKSQKSKDNPRGTGRGRLADIRARNQRIRDRRAAAEEAEAATGVAEADLSAFAANKKRYDDYMAQQQQGQSIVQPGLPDPYRPNPADQMDRARMMYERQNRGAGPVPRQMQGLNQFRNPQMRRMMAPGTGGSGVQRGLNTPPSMQGNGNQRSVGAILQQDGSIDNTAMMQQRRGYQPAVMPPYNGRMPRPQPPQQNQATSPAFRYAGQNYDRLGGQQRMYDRPMEMMSQRERQGVNNIYDNMDRPIEYRQQGGQQGIASLIQNMMSNKGGGRTAPQPQMPRYQTMRPQAPNRGRPMQSYGGKGAGQTMPQQSDFGRMLASRFGG